MASNINANNIDGTYPVAGVDNDSQGFRTNFTNIKNNFAYAKAEITDLQSKVLLKSALTGTALDNNLSGALLSGGEIRDFRETRFDHGTVTGTITLNHANGHYQQATTSGDISLAFSNIPAAGKVARIRFEITVTSTAHHMEMPAAVSLGLDGIAGYDSTTNRIVFNQTGTYLFEFTTDDSGTSYIIQDLLRPRDYFYSQQITLQPRTITDARGSAADVEGMIAVDTSTPAFWVSTGDYDGTTLIWKRVELETATNEFVLSTDVSTTSTSLASITGLRFIAEPNVYYRFEAYLPFTHSASATNTHTFSIAFDQGTCYATIEQQAGPTSAPSIATISTTNATTSTVTTSSTSVKMCRFTGTYYTTAGREPVRLRFATSAGTLTVKAGAYFRFTRV